MLLAVSSLNKQDLILGFSWLKDYNPEENIEITCCPPRYNSYQDFQKIKRVEEKTIAIC